VAGDGLKGLTTFRENSDEIVLVISDVTMPEMNGVEMGRRIYSTSPATNVVLMSGLLPPELSPEEIAGLCAFLQKPFRAGHLTEIVKNCLSSRCGVMTQKMRSNVAK
jgi:DNA-binding NtrC family response regulator